MQQCRTAEIMDDAALESRRHFSALGGLARINRISRSAALIAAPIADLARTLPHPPRILDIATGGGDVPAALARRGWSVDACDRSDRAIAFARDHHPAVRFFTLDVLNEPLPAGYDVITCSLFLHHLDRDEAINVLRAMAAAAGSMIVANDLDRTPLGYAAAWLGTRIITRCDVVHVDGPRSVRAAYTPQEAANLAADAGLHHASIRRRFPFRWVLTWRR